MDLQPLLQELLPAVLLLITRGVHGSTLALAGQQFPPALIAQQQMTPPTAHACRVQPVTKDSLQPPGCQDGQQVRCSLTGGVQQVLCRQLCQDEVHQQLLWDCGDVHLVLVTSGTKTSSHGAFRLFSCLVPPRSHPLPERIPKLIIKMCQQGPETCLRQQFALRM